MSDEDRARQAVIDATKAACNVKFDDYRASGVRSINLARGCTYPLCHCQILPKQIAVALAVHQATALAGWKAEVSTMREPPEELDATDRARLPGLMRKAAARIEAEGDDPVRELDPGTQLGA